MRKLMEYRKPIADYTPTRLSRGGRGLGPGVVMMGVPEY